MKKGLRQARVTKFVGSRGAQPSQRRKRAGRGWGEGLGEGDHSDLRVPSRTGESGACKFPEDTPRQAGGTRKTINMQRFYPKL